MIFLWIIIGLIILIPITDINIIPNFLGYSAIIFGLTQIRKISSKFTIAIIPLILLLIYSLLIFTGNIMYLLDIKDNFIISIFENKSLSIIFKLFEGRYSLIYGVFALLFYIGIEEKARSIGYNALSKQARNLLFLILFFLAITTIPYIKVLPPIFYQVLTYIITFFELIIVYTTSKTLKL